jgi:hypothetical protein
MNTRFSLSLRSKDSIAHKCALRKWLAVKTAPMGACGRRETRLRGFWFVSVREGGLRGGQSPPLAAILIARLPSQTDT